VGFDYDVLEKKDISFDKVLILDQLYEKASKKQF